MLEYLKLTDVGPAPTMAIELTPRLNFLTGDNGLGKTFLLDIGWWALTRTWARMPAAPQRGADKTPAIGYRYQAKTSVVEYESVFDREAQGWPAKQGRPPIPGMVIYAQVDGGFSAWDPARNYWRKDVSDGPDRPASFVFEPDEVWEGLPRGQGKKLCNGLIADWASWQREKGQAFEQLTAVLRALSPSEQEPLVPGKLTRVSLDDVRDQPTLVMPYGEHVPLVHASAGIRRIVALAYLLVWTWQEHVQAAELLGKQPVREIIFLIDELEAHLHPQWQRRIVPALLEVMEALTGDHDVPVQLIAATHSPLVLASVEPAFDEERDAVFHLDLRERAVTLDRVPWAKQGDVTGWLVSEVFGLEQARSVDAERAIESAEACMRGETESLPPNLRSREDIHRELLRVLAGHDPFWPRWIVWVEEHGGDAG
jgi:hypothetical protein